MAARPLMIAAGVALVLVACDDHMANQPKRLPYEARYGEAAAGPALPPDGIVARDDKPVSPPPVTLALLHRGQERYDIYCAPCHSRAGDGNGMIVQRGFPHPPSLLAERLRAAPVQHFYDVIANGYGAMFPYRARVAPADRWAIAAYIRALQASGNASLAEVPADRRALLR
jgi:mono/diheme cytochrome c family protein